MILAHGSRVRYQHEVVGINGRLDAIQAAILNVKLKYFADEVRKREEIGASYLELLKDKKVSLPVVKKDRTSVFAQFTIRSEQREELTALINANGIPAAIHYPQPLHLQKCYENLGYKLGDFPIAEKAAHEVFSLPISPFLKREDLAFICQNIS